MDELRELFAQLFRIDGENADDMELERAVVSGPRSWAADMADSKSAGGTEGGVAGAARDKGAGQGIVKVKIRPVELKGGLYFQFESFTKTQAFHENLAAKAAVERMCVLAQGFKQMQIITAMWEYTALVSKKGKVSLKKKRRAPGEVTQSKRHREENAFSGAGMTDTPKVRLHNSAKAVSNSARAHNKEKNYILREGVPVPFLVDLGVMTKEGACVKSKSDKFRQINRFLEYVEDVLPHLAKEREVTILDFGCGKSYLTFALYYYLHELKGYDIRIIGLDLKADVIARCSRLAETYGYQKLTFLMGDIARYEGAGEVDMVVTLHACDTATDYALAKAIGWNAKVILSVPCCQHELNRQIRSEELAPIMDYGILKERFAALITDGLRAKYLESMGYETQVLEFIDMEHTPKNILLRAVKSKKMNTTRVKKCGEQIQACEELLGVRPMLGSLIETTLAGEGMENWQR